MLHLVDIRATFLPYLGKKSGVILETEGSIWKIQKVVLSQYKKLKRAPLIGPPSVLIASLQLF